MFDLDSYKLSHTITRLSTHSSFELTNAYLLNFSYLSLRTKML